MTQTLQLQIDTLAHKGDGVANTASAPIYIPFVLPGETVEARQKGARADLVRVITPSAERIAPVCRHFMTCGGCALQHMAHGPYLEWKRDQLRLALNSRGLDAPIEPMRSATASGRRRAVLTATKAGHKTLLGYHQRQNNMLVDLEECPVLVAEITTALPKLKKLAELAVPRRGELKMTIISSQTGLDVALERKEAFTERMTRDLTMRMASDDFARLSANGEVLIEIRPPLTDMDGAAVTLPPAGFLQATNDAQKLLSELVIQGMGKSRKIADLFSGAGTFTFPLAKIANVHAVEGDAAAVKALDQGMRRAASRKTITIERRDLFRRPLMAAELDDFGDGYDAVVFDPPRAGAEAQAQELARSKVKTVVAVSCNPATLARDLRLLVDGGFQIERVTPVDQFQYTPHTEVVAVLKRP